MRHVFGFDGSFYGWQPLLNQDGGGGGGQGGEGGDKGKGDQGGEGGDKNKGGEKKPIQFEDEAALMARMARHTKAEQDKAAKALGFESWEAMQEAAKKAKAADEAAKTEAEKLRDAQAKAEAKAAEVATKAQNALLAAEVKAQSVALGIVDPDAALALMNREGVKIDLDASKVEGVKEALTELLKAKPYLKGNSQNLPKDGGGDFSQERKPPQGGGLEGALARHYAGQKK